MVRRDGHIADVHVTQAKGDTAFGVDFHRDTRAGCPELARHGISPVFGRPTDHGAARCLNTIPSFSPALSWASMDFNHHNQWSVYKGWVTVK